MEMTTIVFDILAGAICVRSEASTPAASWGGVLAMDTMFARCSRAFALVIALSLAAASSQAAPTT